MNALRFTLFILAGLLAALPLKAQRNYEELTRYTDLKLNFAVRQFDYQRYNQITQEEKQEYAGPDPLYIQMDAAKWKIQCELEEIPGRENLLDGLATFILVEGDCPAANVGVELEFGQWGTDHYLLMPAAAYNGNRFKSRKIPYSPKLMDPRDIGKDKPTTVTDIPRLNIENGPSQIRERSGSMASPGVGTYDPQQEEAFWIGIEQANAWGDYGITFTENRDRDRAWLSFDSPIVRQHMKYQIVNNHAPSTDIPADFKKGDTVQIHFRMHFRDGLANLSGLFDLYTEQRKDLAPKTTYQPIIPYAAAWDVQEEKYNRDNWVENPGYYAIGMRENFLQDWQIGWTGGMITSYPLLFEGDATTQARVKKMFQWLMKDGFAPSGYFWDSGEDGDKWYGGDIRYPHTKNWHLVRKSGDGLYFILQQFMLMKQRGENVPTEWEAKVKKVAENFRKTFEQEGQLGDFVHSITGEIMVGGSTSGAIVPAALVLAAEYFKEPAYKEVAKEIGEYYYQNFTAKGYTTGGPGDAMQNPDSESSYAIIEAYVSLFEATQDDKWLDYAKEAADQFSTWTMAYDFNFPDTSCFGQMGIRSTGSVFANVQNKHSAPHICTHSGWALLRLYRYTADDFYAELLKDILFNATQYLSTERRPVCKMKPGWINERVQVTDWEDHKPIGEVFPGSTWAETALMLGHIQVPGLYINGETDDYILVDNLIVESFQKKGSSYTIKLKNPTAWDAELRWYLDKDPTKTLDPNYLLDQKTLKIPAGKSKVLKVRG